MFQWGVTRFLMHNKSLGEMLFNTLITNPMHNGPGRFGLHVPKILVWRNLALPGSVCWTMSNKLEFYSKIPCFISSTYSKMFLEMLLRVVFDGNWISTCSELFFIIIVGNCSTAEPDISKRIDSKQSGITKHNVHTGSSNCQKKLTTFWDNFP